MRKTTTLLVFISLIISSCATKKVINTPLNKDLGGASFFTLTEKMTPAQYDSTVVSCYEKGQIPANMRYFHKINVEITTPEGEKIKAHYYVSPDYICVGTSSDVMRTPLLPSSAQKIADMTGCFLSTSKICDDVYSASGVKIEPVPMTCDRETHYTFRLHNMIISSQLKGRKGLISGSKKDVVLVPSLTDKKGKLALYGWHKADGRPIQPVYTGHADYYVDYSHGYRLVYKTIWVNGKKMDYKDVLSHPQYYKILSYELNDSFFAYPIK